MSITKCVDCERRIDVDIEEAYYGDDDQCLCEDCNDVVQNDKPKTKEVWNGYGRGTRTISVVQNDEPKTYKIIRFFRDDNNKNKVILTGLTLEQAQNHCQDPDTSGDGWFDGYTKEIK